jgi:hypothetical protein
LLTSAAMCFRSFEGAEILPLGRPSSGVSSSEARAGPRAEVREAMAAEKVCREDAARWEGLLVMRIGKWIAPSGNRGTNSVDRQARGLRSSFRSWGRQLQDSDGRCNNDLPQAQERDSFAMSNAKMIASSACGERMVMTES